MNRIRCVSSFVAFAITSCADASRVDAEPASEEQLLEPVVVFPAHDPRFRPFPVWTKGRAWRSSLYVEVLDDDGPRWLETGMTYQVLDVESDGTTKILACGQDHLSIADDPRLQVTWTFDPAGRIVDAYYDPPMYDCDYNDVRGYFGCQEYWPGAEYLWPRFPLTASKGVRHDGEIFRIDVDGVRRKGLARGKHYRAHIQWMEGRAWYDSFRIDAFDPAAPERGWRPYLVEHVGRWDEPPVVCKQ